MEENTKKKGTSQCYHDHHGKHFHSKIIENVTYHKIQLSDKSVNSDFSPEPTERRGDKEEMYDYGHVKTKWKYKAKKPVQSLLDETEKHQVSTFSKHKIGEMEPEEKQKKGGLIVYSNVDELLRHREKKIKDEKSNSLELTNSSHELLLKTEKS